MDKEYGLPSLEDNSFDLLLTDPPYNIEATITKGLKYNHRRDNYIKIYEDKIENYKEWCEKWYLEGKRIAKMVGFTCGKNNPQLWYTIDNFHLVTWFIPNSSSRGFVSKFVKSEPILFSGDFKQNKLKFDIINAYVDSGFLVKPYDIIHPHPKPLRLYNKIIKELNPLSVIDPFLGSGTTAEVCEKLAIPWIGYEINEVYSQDIEKRLRNVKVEPKQQSLEGFLAPEKYEKIEVTGS